MRSISVVIPAYNEEKYIAHCLESILTYESGNVIEVIVVDNASTDRTAELAASFSGVRVVHEPNKGLTAARQCGLNAARGELVAYIDADSNIPADWFGHINAAFKRDLDLVCLSGPYDYVDLSTLKRACVRAFWNIVAMPAYFLTGYMVVGGNFVARKEALKAIGGFDTSIAFYGEDTDIARRLHARGHVRFLPSFTMQTSARRLNSQGLVRTGFIYMKNFLSESLLHRPATATYSDIR